MSFIRFRGLAAILAAGSLVVSSTGAAAATTSLPEVSPWAALTAMSGGAPAAALCGAAAVAAAAQAPAGGCVLPVVDQPVAAVNTNPPPTPVPVPPVEPVGGGLGFGVDPLLLALGVLAAGGLAYLLLHKKHHDNNASPA